MEAYCIEAIADTGRQEQDLRQRRVCFEFLAQGAEVGPEVVVLTPVPRSPQVRASIDLSDDQLDRLLSCMGYRLEVVRHPVVPQLTRPERRSWQLHRQLSTLLNQLSFEEWRPTLEHNLLRLSNRVTGQPHERNVDRWRQLIERGDLPDLHRVLTGLDRDSIEMREVSPMGGLLTREQRDKVIGVAN